MARQNRKPIADDSFVRRICYALDTHPTQLCRLLDLPYGEIKPLLKLKASDIGDLDYDIFWQKLYEHIGERLGMLLAVRSELDTLMQKQRTERLTRLTGKKDV